MQRLNITTVVLPPQQDTGRARFIGNRLIIAKIFWCLIAFLAAGMLIVSVPLQFNSLRVAKTDRNQIYTYNADLHPDEVSLLAQLGLSTDFYASEIIISHVLATTIMFTIGTIIFWRRPDDRVAFFISMTLILLGTFSGVPMPFPGILTTIHPIGQFLVNLLFSLTGFGMVVSLYIFPDGHFVPKWTKWVAAIWAVVTLMPTIAPDSPVDVTGWPILPFLIVTLIPLAVGAYAQQYRYRYVATPTQRQQTKWAVFGYSLFFVVIALSASGLAFVPSASEPGMAHLLLNLINAPVYAAALSMLALTIGISILRYRLWDIDLVINRSLVYGALSILLGVIFLGSLLLLQQIFQLFTGGMQPPLALATSALVIGGLFQPARRQLRRFVDRRFYHLIVDVDQLKDQRRPITNPGALTGSKLGTYEVLEHIGVGGMGEVYRGHQTGLARDVAIKVLPRHLASDAEFRARFEREAKIVASLKHPHIVNMFDFGQSDEIYYMTMEYIDGYELGNAIKECGKLPLDLAFSIIRDLASALDYAHTQGLVHRDVKPSNVMLRNIKTSAYQEQQQAVLMDFGIAKIVNAQTRLTGTGIVGTLDYLAPEQIMSSREVDHRADIYALGVVLYQMLTGELPFNEKNAPQVIFGHLYKPAPDPRTISPDIPDNVAFAILRALAKNPDDRFQNASEFVTALGMA